MALQSGSQRQWLSMSYSHFASPQDYSLKVINGIFREGQAGGLNFSGVNVENPDAGFVDPATLSQEQALGVVPVHTIVYWGEFGHPMQDKNLEVMRVRTTTALDWRVARRIILGSTVGGMQLNGLVRHGKAQPQASGSDLSGERAMAICANAGVPISVFLLAQAPPSGKGKELNTGFLWHPDILEPRFSLAGLQAAVALRIEDIG